MPNWSARAMENVPETAVRQSSLDRAAPGSGLCRHPHAIKATNSDIDNNLCMASIETPVAILSSVRRYRQRNACLTGPKTGDTVEPSA